MTDTIYYLTGRGGQLNKGLGEALLAMGFKLSGREMSGTFMRLTFQNQIDLVSQDLQDNFWQKDSKVIAVSYGANMLLNVLADIESYPGSILLLSPVIGSVTNAESMHYFIPPRSKKLMDLIENKKFPKPNKLEIHVGDKDWQSPYERDMQFAEAVGGDCYVVPDTGHQLGKIHVGAVLDRWCKY